MSSGGLNHLPIEYIPFLDTIPLAVLFLGFIQVSLYIVLDWDNRIYSFFLGSSKCSSVQKEQPSHLKSSGVAQHEKKSQDSGRSMLLEQKNKHEERGICRGDAEVVFRSLGLLSHPPREQEESARSEERLDCNDVFDLFEEKEPSEEEVRAAFDVFDENQDGFVDARELQRVLLALGLREGAELENCRRMINAAGEDGDGKIDFNEFIKFMDSIFC